MSKIVGIGSSVHDTLMVTREFPAEDTKIQAQETFIQGGGPCATALVAASKLGVTSSYIGTLGNDIYGSYMMDDFKRYGVGIDNIIQKDDYVSFHSFVILNSSSSSRTCIWNKGTIPELQHDEINLNTIKNAELLHLDGHQLDAAIYAAGKARENGVKVSLDAGGVYPGIEKLLPLVDFLIPSEEFVLKIMDKTNIKEAAAALYAKYKPEVFIVTQGSRGGFFYNGREYERYRSFTVDAIDTNGAGDVFHGAFIAGYVKGMDIRKTIHFASAVAALKCTQIGARNSVPSYDNTIQFLGRNGFNEF
ncbi:MAG: PfkB family carbohydrate kinase [Clostridia bacterium]|nr:PfkB family carbohydrate kinase [Clostridia bacterium]